MNTKVLYSTEAFLDRNGGQPGTQTEATFASLDEARMAPLPAGYTFAYIQIDEGYYIYSPRTGWEFHVS